MGYDKKGYFKSVLKGRSLFRPKHKEVNEQCVSCPFRAGNDKEFGKILDKLAELHGVKRNSTKFSRLMVLQEATINGEFVCHYTAYNTDWSSKDQSEHRQCVGATQWFKTHAPGQYKEK